MGNSTFFSGDTATFFFSGITSVGSSAHAFFSKVNFIFPLFSHGMLLGYILPEVHSQHTTSLTEHRHGKNELSLLVILLVGLWHSVGEDFTSGSSV